MQIQIDDKDKVRVLLTLLEQNAQSIEWVKGFDYKIAYQFLFLYAAIVTFIAKITVSDQARCVLF